MRLLDQIAQYQNLRNASNLCSKGKRSSRGYQIFLSRYSDELVNIRQQLLSGSYRWSRYRSFMVHDPKARIISAPEFRDRVVHTAICSYLEPLIESRLSKAVYACRKGRGNRNAVIELHTRLRRYGKQRFVVKLDVSKYFDSIEQNLLLEKIHNILPDDSLTPLLNSLIKSYHSNLGEGKGLPIGALTSQLFANFYLSDADKVVDKALAGELYIRYMDDLVLCGESRESIWKAANEVRDFVANHLHLSIPYSKVVPLGCDPIPFLGFVIDHTGYRILARNRRRHSKKIRRLVKKGARESEVEQVRLSFAAWQELNPHLSIRMNENSC